MLIDDQDLLDPPPDAVIVMKSRDTAKSKKSHYFLEVIDEGTPRYYLRYRINRYMEYIEDTNRTITPLFICPNVLIFNYLNRYIPDCLVENQLDNTVVFATCLSQNVREHGFFNANWSVYEYE